VELTAEQCYELERLWYYYGNRGPKTAPGNHGFIQGLIERFQDERPTRSKYATPTPECEAAVERILAGQIIMDGLSVAQKADRESAISEWESRIEEEQGWIGRFRRQRSSQHKSKEGEGK
jgi:hypothetical protein